MRAWQPEDPVDREEWERRAAAQAREFYSRRRPAPPPGPAAGKPPAEISPGQKGTPSPAEMPEENQKTAPGKAPVPSSAPFSRTLALRLPPFSHRHPFRAANPNRGYPLSREKTSHP